jgi:nucleoside-diphosphate-sugar epimerase
VTIALTGATGFVGRHVLDELLARGQTVAATLRPGSSPPRQAPELRWVEVDIAQPPARAYQRLECPEVLIHLAWEGLPNYQSLHHFETELPRHYQFLADLVRQGLPTLIAAGTCLEYGMQYGPLASDGPTLPVNPYGFAKDALLRQLKFLRLQHPFQLIWTRLFYMYGDGQSQGSLLPLLRREIAKGSREFAMSGGEQLRDYLPVTEVARQLVDHALAPRDLGAINICSGIPVSVRRLVEGWIAEHGWDIALKLHTLPYPEYEPMAFWGVKEASPS